MTITYPVLGDSIVINQFDDKVAEAISYLRSNNYDAAPPASPVAGEFWIGSADDTLQVYLGGTWIPFRSFDDGKAVIWCDDQPEEIRLLAPDTGIVAGGYNMVLPAGAGSASQAWRVASVDGNTLTLEWFTPTASSLALDGLTDVDAGSPTNGQVLAFNSGSGNWEPSSAAGGGATDLDGLSDVSLTSVTTGDLLRYDGADFVNTPLVLGDIPDLSSLYAAASHTHALSAITASGATAGKFPRWNGAAWVPVSITAGDLPAAYLPLTGGTVTGASTFANTLTVGPAGTLAFSPDSGGNQVNITGPASLAQSYSWSLPDEGPQLALEYSPVSDSVGGAGGLAVMAVNKTTLQGVWIEIDGAASGGRLVLNGYDDDTESGNLSSPIYGATLHYPFITQFQNAEHDHDGSPGIFDGFGNGDGSNTLDLLYTAKLTGGPLVPKVGGTGRTAITAGALLLGGSSTVAIPTKPGVDNAENNGQTYKPMVELLGNTEGAAIVWDATAGAWVQGPVPTAITLDSPSAGDLVFHNGSAFVHGKSLTHSIRFQKSIECGDIAGSLPGSVRLYQPPVVGSRHLTLIAPSAPASDLTMTLPAAGGVTGDCLVTTTTGSSMVLALGSPVRVSGVGFGIGAADVGDLMRHDGGQFVPLSPGLEDQVLTVTAGGDIAYAYAPGRTFSVVRSLGGVEGAITVAALPRAREGLTLTAVDVYTKGTSASVTYQVTIDGVDAFPSNRTASGDGSVSSESIVAAVSTGDVVLIEIQSVSGSVSEAVFQLSFRK